MNWENILYVAPKSGQQADTGIGRFTVRRASKSSRTFRVRHNNVLAKASFTSVMDGIKYAEMWYDTLKSEEKKS